MELFQRYGPSALILGGSDGVGLSFAQALARAGFSLVLVGRDPQRLATAAEDCVALGAAVRTLAVDLTEPGAADEVVAAVADLEIGLLICNAGANTSAAPVLAADLSDLQRVIALNVGTPLAVIHQLGRAMSRRARGGIIVVGSLTGYLGGRHHAVYAAAKAFTRVLCEGLWLELRDQQVDVLHMVLGVTRTPAMQRVGLNFDVAGMQVSEPDEVVAQALQAIGTGPVRIVAGQEQVAEFHQRSDRARVVLGADRMLQALTAGATAGPVIDSGAGPRSA